MIDAQAAGVAQRRAYRREERSETAGDQRARREAGKPPVLATRIEQVGRRANRKTAQHVALTAPCVAAARVHADGQIADQADAHSRIERAALRYAEGSIGEPLQETVEQHLALVRRREDLDGGTVRIAQICSANDANRPHPSRGLGRMQRFEHRVLRQQFAAIGAEAGKVQMERAVGVPAHR